MLQEKFRKSVVDFLLLLLFVFAIYLLIKKIFFLLFPFCLAYLLSEGIRKNLDRLKPLSPLAKRILTVLVLLIFFSLLSLFAVLFAERLIHYSTAFATYLSKNIDTFTNFCNEKIKSLESMASSLLRRDMENSITLYLPEFFKNLLQKVLEKIPSSLGSLLSFFPKFFISLLVFLLSCYYFSCDWPRISSFLSKKLKPEKKEAILRGKKQFFLSLKQFIKAYALLFTLSFSILFFGLVLLKIKNAFGIAILIAFVDLLPVLGCGTVLIPWSLILFFSGNAPLGTGILFLHFVILLIRQLAEPKILGSSIGLHPLLSLLLVLLGLCFFGLWGMILFPLTFACLFHLKEKSGVENTPQKEKYSFNK